jgi:hypothetical protein
MIRWLLGFYYSRLRRIDLQVLWPACLDQTRDIEHARAVFAVHAFHDPAWLFLGGDEIIRTIDGLQ